MRWVAALSYLAGVALFLYLMITILFFLLKKDCEPRIFLKWFLAAAIADILSTIYFVHVLGFGWTVEGNSMVREFGSSIGHLNALLINHFLVLSGLYILGLILKGRPQGLKLVYGIFILLFSSAVFINVIFSTLRKIFGGHL